MNEIEERRALRNALAAHAPFPPQWNEAPVMDTARPEPETTNDPETGARIVVNHGALDAWDREAAHRRRLEWPFVWADAVLAAGDRRDRARAAAERSETT
ncbi:MAG TPA: hypothetical protein VKE69_01065 [Planctomycetota bacterium]|nr:hypothetical protein [Planctomycetota bacterium]